MSQETRVRASSVDDREEVFVDHAEPRASSVDEKVGTKRQRNQKDESRPKKKKGSARDDDLELSAEIEEMFDSLMNNNHSPNPNPSPKVAVDRAKSKEDDDEIDKLFNVRKKKCVWEKDKAEIALQVEQVMANLELAVEDDVELNKQGKPATNKLIKLPILVGALSKKHLQAEFLDHGVLSLLKNWLEPLPDGSLPNTNIRTSVLQILEDLSIILCKGQGCREQLIKSGLAKVVMFLSKSDEETRLNRRLANDLVNRWGHMVYDRSTRYENMLSQEEREEQEEMLSRRREKKKAPQVRVEECDLDVDFTVKAKPKGPACRVVTVPTALSMDFVLRPRQKVDERLIARAKMQVDNGRYEGLTKRVKRKKALREESMQALKLSVDGRTKPKY